MTPTTTKWVDEECLEFVTFRLVARDFKPQHGGPRVDLYAAMLPHEAKKALFAYVVGSRRARRNRGEPEVKLMFVNVALERPIRRRSSGRIA